jgi:hypothetical protein
MPTEIKPWRTMHSTSELVEAISSLTARLAAIADELEQILGPPPQPDLSLVSRDDET